MLKWLMQKGIAAFERKWDYDASYVHELIDSHPLAVWKFSRDRGNRLLSQGCAARGAWTAAASQPCASEDCGPCTQLGVAMAERSASIPKVLRAVLAETAAAMPPDVALAWRFTRATIDHDPIGRSVSR